MRSLVFASVMLISTAAMAQSPQLIFTPKIPDECHGPNGCTACLKITQDNTGTVEIGACINLKDMWTSPGAGGECLTTAPCSNLNNENNK